MSKLFGSWCYWCLLCLFLNDSSIEIEKLWSWPKAKRRIEFVGTSAIIMQVEAVCGLRWLQVKTAFSQHKTYHPWIILTLIVLFITDNLLCYWLYLSLNNKFFMEIINWWSQSILQDKFSRNIKKKSNRITRELSNWSQEKNVFAKGL